MTRTGVRWKRLVGLVAACLAWSLFVTTAHLPTFLVGFGSVALGVWWPSVWRIEQ